MVKADSGSICEISTSTETGEGSAGYVEVELIGVRPEAQNRGDAVFECGGERVGWCFAVVDAHYNC